MIASIVVGFIVSLTIVMLVTLPLIRYWSRVNVEERDEERRENDFAQAERLRKILTNEDKKWLYNWSEPWRGNPSWDD